MTTWKSIVNAALSECGITTPDKRLSPQNLLMWASEARHDYQSWTRAVRRECPISITAPTPNYKLPYAAKRMTIDFARFSTVPGATSLQDGRVRMISWDTYVQLSTQLLSDNPNAQLIADPAQLVSPINTPFVAAVNAATNEIWLNPVATGNLYLRYTPELVAYSPDDTDEWTDFAGDPSKAMESEGPEDEFRPALTGIKAYVKMKIAETGAVSPQMIKMFYGQWQRTFEDQKYLLGREDTNYNEEEPIYYTAGLH